MTGIVQEIGRSFLVSCFLPAMVFVSLSRLLFLPVFLDLFPAFSDGSRPLDFLVHADFGQTIVLTAVVSAFVGYLLWSLHHCLVKLFEGYYCPVLLKRYKKRHEKRRKWMFDKISELRRKCEIEQDKAIRQYLENQFIAKQMKFETFYPPHKEDIMPTAIGNVFRAFEQYPDSRYGIDAVHFWPHLISVIPSGSARLVEEANNTLTFLLTSCLMCCLLGIESLGAMVRLIFFPITPYVIGDGFLKIPISHSSEYWFYGILAICAFGMAFALKRGALEASITFGEIVKSCFDLCHRDLLKKIVGETALKDERRAWARLHRSIQVNREVWLPEWEDEEGRVRGADKPESHSRPEPAFVWA